MNKIQYENISPVQYGSDNSFYIQALSKVAKKIRFDVLNESENQVLGCIVDVGMTQEQTARYLGISQPSVSRIYANAKHKLRENLEIASLGIKTFISIKADSE